MLTASVSSPAVRKGLVFEPKFDGLRAFAARPLDAAVLIRSRHGTDLTSAFPEIADALSALPRAAGDVLLDCELVLWSQNRLNFEALLTRMNRTAANARRLAAQLPANLVAFDLLHYGLKNDLLNEPYRVRRLALERLFSRYRLEPPFALCPATTDPEQVAEWLTHWIDVGIEGLVMKNPDTPYLPGSRAWQKYRVRSSTEALVAAVTGSLTRPATVLLGRYDQRGLLRYAGRSTPLKVGAALALAALLTPADARHPWHGRRFSANWGASTPLEAILVAPELVAEVSTDVARLAGGQWRHPVRYLRVRPDVDPADVPLYGADDQPAAS